MTQQRKTREEDEFDAAFDERGQLKDGITRVRVPIKLMDSAGGLPKGQGRSIYDMATEYARVRLEDRKPGFTPSASLRTAKWNSMYDELDAELAEQFKNPTGIGSHGFSGGQIGDRCTVRRGAGRFGVEGSDGRLQLINGKLECVADGHDLSAAKKPGKPRAQEIYDPALGSVRPHGAGYDAKDHDTRDAEYSRYDTELANAWRRRAT